MIQVIVLPEAVNNLKQIDKSIAKRITNKLDWLSNNWEIVQHLSLKGEFSGLFKLRIGDWRVIYEIDYDSNIIYIHKVGHRKDIYR